MNVKSEDLQTHLARLRGDVKIGAFVSIDNRVLKVTEPFNIYLLAEEFDSQLKANGKNLATIGHEDLSFVAWLQILGIAGAVTIVPSDAGPVPNYLVTPVSPSARNIVKILLIISNAVGDEQLPFINERDVYIYAIFKDIVRAIPYDKHLDALGNVKKLSKAGEQALEQVLLNWSLRNGSKYLEEILCFNVIPASRVSAFENLS